MTKPDLQSVRRWFAEELRYVVRVRSPGVVQAFASVPREHFAGPGPWRILSPRRSEDYWSTEDADPRSLYHDVLIAIDETRRLNNGQPSLWAQLFDVLGLTLGDHVIHVGAGNGYYSAILAEIVGPTGRVTAIEIDPGIAARAKSNLAIAWPQATVIAADGFAYRPDGLADAIVVNAGVTHFSLAWLDALAPENGRLLVPLTRANWTGGFLLITRHAGETRRYPVRYVMWTGIIPCVGGRNSTAEAQLNEALARSGYDTIRSLRRTPDEPDKTCWLAGDGWWLSTAEASPDSMKQEVA